MTSRWVAVRHVLTGNEFRHPQPEAAQDDSPPKKVSCSGEEDILTALLLEVRVAQAAAAAARARCRALRAQSRLARLRGQEAIDRASVMLRQLTHHRSC